MLFCLPCSSEIPSSFHCLYVSVSATDDQVTNLNDSETSVKSVVHANDEVQEKRSFQVAL